MEQKVTIYDIARMTGVSIATVSRVVNGSDKVKEKTRQKVLEAMKECGYTPNVFARGLGLDSMKTIGILCPDITDSFVAEAVAFLEKRLRQYGYDCILRCSGYDKQSRETNVRLLLAKRVDTLVLVGSTYTGKADASEETDYIREAAKITPVFLINGYVEGENVYCSYCDDYQAVYELVRGYIQQGKKKILFLYNSYSYSARQKLAGYEAALQDAGYPVREELEIYTEKDIYGVRDRLLEEHSLEFDGVVANDDSLAIGALKYARAKRLSVPEDLCIAGYNNSTLSISCEPELTSVDNHLEKICNDTIDNMLKLLQGETEWQKENKVPCEIIKRGTT